MTLTIQTQSFRSALLLLTKVAASNAALPILTHIRIRATMMGNVVLEATNLETSLRIRLPGANADLDTAVPAKTLADIFAAIDSPTASMSINDEKVLIAAGGAKSRLSMQSGDEFPQLPNCELVAAVLPALELKRALKKVAMAASNDQSRPALMSIQIAPKGSDKITFAAADGFRLAVQELNATLNMPKNARPYLLLPVATVRKLLAMLPDSSETVTLSVNKNTSAACFSWGEVDLYAGLLDFSFPDWSQIIPASFTHTLDLPAEFAPAIKRAEIFGREGSHLTLLTPSDDGGMVVSGSADEVGESKTTLESVPMPFKLGLNAIFVQQGLDAIGNNVHLHVTAPAAPAMLTNGSREYIYLIMPMFLESAKTAEAAAAAEQSVAANAEA